MIEPKTFRGTIRPAVLVNILLGVGVFELSSDRRVKKFVEMIYAICYIVLMEAVFYFTIISATHYDISLQALGSFVVIMDPVIPFSYSYQLSCLLVIAVRWKSKIMSKVIHLMEENDRKMEAIGLPRCYRSQYKYQLRCICFLILFCVLVATNSMTRSQVSAMPLITKIVNCIGLNITTVLCITTNYTFCFWLRYIRFKFHQLNHLLKKMIKTLDPPNQKRFLQGSDDFEVKRFEDDDNDSLIRNVDTIRKMKKSHLALIRIARQVNTFYGIQLLLTWSIMMVRLVITFYVINKLIWYPSYDEEIFIKITYSVLFLLFTFYKTTIVHRNCIETSCKAAQTGDLLCRLYDISTTTEFHEEIQNFAFQVLQNPLSFSICGLIDYDRSFVSNTFGKLCGYLLVLSQIEMQRIAMVPSENSTAVRT